MDIKKEISETNQEIQSINRLGYDIGAFPISPDETMPNKFRNVYDAHGQSFLHLADTVNNLTHIRPGSDYSIMDIPCGHGRVMRAMRTRWPTARILACDQDEMGIAFCEKTFAASPLPWTANLDDIRNPTAVDLMWCGSLLPHLPADKWKSLFNLAKRALKPKGILIFTYAGPFVTELAKQGEGMKSIAPPKASLCFQDYDKTGFGFAQYNNDKDVKSQDIKYPYGKYPYGRSFARPYWVIKYLDQFSDTFRLVLHFEKGWTGRQDVVALQKRA